MPLGSLRAPTSGWLIVLVAPRPYGVCSEIRMYSLASGAAFVRQDCKQAGPRGPSATGPGRMPRWYPTLALASCFMANAIPARTRLDAAAGWARASRATSVGRVRDAPGSPIPSGVVQVDRARDMGQKTAVRKQWLEGSGLGLAGCPGGRTWPAVPCNGRGTCSVAQVDMQLNSCVSPRQVFTPGCPKEKPPGRFNVASTRL